MEYLCVAAPIMMMELGQYKEAEEWLSSYSDGYYFENGWENMHLALALVIMVIRYKKLEDMNTKFSMVMDGSNLNVMVRVRCSRLVVNGIKKNFIAEKAQFESYLDWVYETFVIERRDGGDIEHIQEYFKSVKPSNVKPSNVPIIDKSNGPWRWWTDHLLQVIFIVKMLVNCIRYYSCH